MHLLVRERAFLDEERPAEDLLLEPAPLLFASFSDADLALMAAPDVACAPLARLAHPMSVDLFVDRTVRPSTMVVLRLLGGIPAWRYGVDEIEAACRAEKIPLALIPGCSRREPDLQARSTIPPAAWTALDTLLRTGGPDNFARARTLCAAIASGHPDHPADPHHLPPFGEIPLPVCAHPTGTAAILAYRSHVLADDLAPHLALAEALATRGIAAHLLHVASPRAPDCAPWLADRLRALAPHVVLNATCFSSRDADGASALDAPDVPVLQLVLAGTDAGTWQNAHRGLAPADLAMQIVLPELDGRIAAPVVSLKHEHQGTRRNTPLPDGIALAADRAAGWIRLATKPRAQRRLAILLSDYPGARTSHAMGYAVGLDTFSSLAAILEKLRDAGYRCDPDTAAALTDRLCRTDPVPIMTEDRYQTLFATLPSAVRDAIVTAHGEPRLAQGHLVARIARTGTITAAIQPVRDPSADRRLSHHDRVAPPGHAYVAFHLWLRLEEDVDALIQLGTHGTLEWLPGRPDAASSACTQSALLRGLPVIYPFIVNNPGEASVAKRRLGAITLGHLTPALRPATLDADSRAIELLLEELAAADGIDRRRADALRRDILDRAASCRLLAETGPGDDPIAQLDSYLCDIKELRIADGLHVFGTAPHDPDAMQAMLGPGQDHALSASPGSETASLIAALDGRRVAPGPAGSPGPTRCDVLPTGRNLVGSDVRLLPTETAMRSARARAADLHATHLLDQGTPLEKIVLDLWGSPSLRTGGEDLALAFHLLGAVPLRDPETARLTGVELLPDAILEHARVDVSLRISGLFRDMFALQIDLFDRAVRMIAARSDRPAEPRVFGPAPGTFGARRTEWLADSAHAYGIGRDGEARPDILETVVANAGAFLHQQDNDHTDVLDGSDHAAHSGGFSAAARALGNIPALYHARIGTGWTLRTLSREIARVTRGRLANPEWLAGQRRHGFRGASEMARGTEALLEFARSLDTSLDPQFDLLSDSLLHDPANRVFLETEGPEALAAIVATLETARAEGLWHPRRNAP